MKKKLWQRFVRAAFLLLLGILRLVPWKPATAWGETMGLLGYRVSARYRRIAEKNLGLAYGDSLSAGERATIIKRVFRNFARMALVEFLKAPSMTPAQIRALVKADSWEYVETLLARGRGLIIISAHFGNWELLARRAALEGYHFAVVVRQSHDSAFNAITDRVREGGGYTVHPRGGSVRSIMQRLRQNGIIAILPDQKSDNVFLPFFGHCAGTVAGPAVLALKTGAAILPLFCPRQPDGTYLIEVQREVEAVATGDHEADVRRIMIEITERIEEIVRRYPDQWFWLHDRWRLPPGYQEETAETEQPNHETTATAAH